MTSWRCLVTQWFVRSSPTWLFFYAMRLCCASLSVFDLPGGRLGGLVPPQVVGDRCMVTENSGLGVGLLVIYYYFYTCFLSNKMPQKLWAAGVLPRTLLRKVKAFSQTSDISALLLKNFTLCSRPCGPRALGPKQPPPTVFFWQIERCSLLFVQVVIIIWMCM